MKKLFESRYNKDAEFYENLLSNATVVLDTNVLLRLYKFSEPTRNYFLEVLFSIKDRLWLPYQVGNEFFANRLSVICEQIKSYTEFEKNINSIKTKLDDKRSHPFLSENILDMLNSSFAEVTADLHDSKKKYEDLINNDIILHKILELYEGKAGKEYPLDDVDNLIKIATDRYSKKIPPGYMDFKSKGGDKPDQNLSNYDKVRPYGDYFLWRQTIDYAKNKFDVVLVTDDVKEDWYSEAMGKTIGPRHELLAEFKHETNQELYLYQSDIFIKRIENSLGKIANNAALEEIKESYKHLIHIGSSKEQSSIDTYHVFSSLEMERQNLKNTTIKFLGLYEETKNRDHNTLVEKIKSDYLMYSHIPLKFKREINAVNEHINKLMNLSEYILDPKLNDEISMLIDYKSLLEKQIDAIEN